MRVYEFAKAHNLSSKELLAILHEHGFEFASHMALLSPQAQAFLSKKYEPQAPKPQLEPSPKVASAPSATPPVPARVQAVTSVSATKESNKVLQAPQSAPAKKTSVDQLFEPKKEQEKRPLQILLQSTTLSDLAAHINKTSSDLILLLLKWGTLSNKNQVLTEEIVAKIAHHYEIPVVRPEPKTRVEARATISATNKEHVKERLPVVVIMGHVDHGKTTLLDYIRNTRVAAKEKGGITQHLGAYEAATPQGNIVFIDTPGHEAFSKIRVRGTKVADVVILVVAADDGVMPQTVEALKQAQAMNVPLIVAINKMDKADKSRLEVVKRELATQYNLLPEEWGGQTVYMPISGKTGQGVDKLLEMVILQAQLLELQAQTTGPALGFILESKLEKGRGIVATVLTQQGALKVGDYFIAGKSTGKVSSLVNSYGQRIEQVGPSHPVLVAGFDELAEAGDNFEVVAKEAYLKARQLSTSDKQPAAQRGISNENSVNLLIKTDTNSSKEALIESIAKISKKAEKNFHILLSGVGNVSESDIMLASNTHSRIITLHVKAEANAISLASRMGVSITSFDIIYKLLEYLQALSESLVPAKIVRTKIGEAVVRKVFDIKNLGVIAGCYLKSGIFTRDGVVTIWRGTKKVGEGKILSLQRDKNVVKEVHAGFECAFMVENFKEWQIDDRVECFVERPENSPSKK